MVKKTAIRLLKCTMVSRYWRRSTEELSPVEISLDMSSYLETNVHLDSYR